jgi:hypothetical protein
MMAAPVIPTLQPDTDIRDVELGGGLEWKD